MEIQKIVVVDDSPVAREMLYRLIRRDHDIVRASSGEELLERIDAELPVVIVTGRNRTVTAG